MSGVLVVTEHRGGVWNRLSWEALAAGQELSKQTGQPLLAAVLGSTVAPLLEELAAKEIERVYGVEHALLEHYTADARRVSTTLRHQAMQFSDFSLRSLAVC